MFFLVFFGYFFLKNNEYFKLLLQHAQQIYNNHPPKFAVIPEHGQRKVLPILKYNVIHKDTLQIPNLGYRKCLSVTATENVSFYVDSISHSVFYNYYTLLTIYYHIAPHNHLSLTRTHAARLECPPSTSFNPDRMCAHITNAPFPKNYGRIDSSSIQQSKSSQSHQPAH